MKLIAPAEKCKNIIDIYMALERAWKPQRRRAIRNYRYVVGNQLDPRAEELLEQQRRPAQVFNLLQDKIIALAGTIEENHAYLKAVPVREGNGELADMHTVLVSDYAIKNCNGYKEIAKAGVDAGIGGIGYVNNYYSFRDDPEGCWISESFDPFMIMFDTLSRKPDWTDLKYYTVSAFYTAEEILQIYRNMSPEMRARIQEEDARITEDTRSKPHSWADRLAGVMDFLANRNVRHDVERGSINRWMDNRSGIYRVVEFHDARVSSDMMLYDPATRQASAYRAQDPEEDDASYNQHAELEATQAGKVAMPKTKTEKFVTVAVPGLLPEDIIYEKPYPVQRKGWQHTPIYCYYFHPDVTEIRSVIDPLIHPQDSFNQRNMTNLELVMQSASPDWLVPKTGIDPEDLPTWKSREKNRLLFYTSTAPPQERELQASTVQALEMLAQSHKDFSEKASGIGPNVQGQSDTKGEGVDLYNSRVQQGMVMLAPLMGNITFAMEQIFTYCDANLQKFMTFEREVRILDKKNKPKWLQLNIQTLTGVKNDISEGEYDFVVDVEQIGRLARQMQFAMTLQMVGKMPEELAFVVWPEVLKLSDLANSDQMAAAVQEIVDMKLGLARTQSKMQIAQGAAGVVSSIEQAARAGEVQQIQPAQEDR